MERGIHPAGGTRLAVGGTRRRDGSRGRVLPSAARRDGFIFRQERGGGTSDNREVVQGDRRVRRTRTRGRQKLYERRVLLHATLAGRERTELRGCLLPQRHFRFRAWHQWRLTPTEKRVSHGVDEKRIYEGGCGRRRYVRGAAPCPRAKRRLGVLGGRSRRVSYFVIGGSIF